MQVSAAQKRSTAFMGVHQVPGERRTVGRAWPQGGTATGRPRCLRCRPAAPRANIAPGAIEQGNTDLAHRTPPGGPREPNALSGGIPATRVTSRVFQPSPGTLPVFPGDVASGGLFGGFFA